MTNKEYIDELYEVKANLEEQRKNRIEFKEKVLNSRGVHTLLVDVVTPMLIENMDKLVNAKENHSYYAGRRSVLLELSNIKSITEQAIKDIDVELRVVEQTIKEEELDQVKNGNEDND